MFLQQSHRPAGRSSTHSLRQRLNYRPRLDGLEDRALPSATHFGVELPEHAIAGRPIVAEVVALDENDERVRDYTGTITFTSTDDAATLPDDYTFRGRDRGRHFFVLTPGSEGDMTLTVTDTADDTITGSATVSVDPAPVATHFFVLTRLHAQVGEDTPVAVVALDDHNRPVFNYTGTVELTSTDDAATLPEPYTFTPEDHGIHIFHVTPGTEGEQTITATDTANAEVTGDVALTVDPAAQATHFAVFTRPSARAGSTVQVLVVALDENDRLAPTYAGTVSLTSSDPDAELPESFTFTPADRGRHVFEVTLNTTGHQTITATDDADTTITGERTINVREGSRFSSIFDGLFGFFARHGRGDGQGENEDD